MNENNERGAFEDGLFSEAHQSERALNRLNRRVFPLTASVGAVLVYSGLRENHPDSLTIGSGLLVLAGFGIFDAATSILKRTNEITVYDSDNAPSATLD